MPKTIHDCLRTLCVFSAVFIVGASISNSSFANSDSTSELQSAVHRMNQWLGAGEKAQGWRRYLLLNVLDTQSAKGNQADIGMLEVVLERFSRDVDGLDHPAFGDVRTAVQKQIGQLSKIAYPTLSDLRSATQTAVGNFRPVSLDEMKYDRDVARYELKLLKKFYRSRLASRDRAMIFLDLELDEAIAFLDEVPFELPPEVSVGKISSLLKDQQRALRKVDDAIDALPVQSPEPSDADEDDDPLKIDVSPPQPDSDPDSLKSLEKRKATLKDRIKELRELGTATLKKDRPRRARRSETVKRLREIHRNFISVGEQRFDPYFVSSAIAFDKFYHHYRYGTEDNIQEDYLKQVMELQKLLPALDDPTDQLSHAKIGSILEWLEQRNQLCDLLTAIRYRYSNPNIYLSISANLINQLGGQSSTDSRIVKELLFGRLARGYATTSTQVSIDLQDDPNQVHASIHLQGAVSSQTYAREKSLRLNATGNGTIEGRRSVYANLNGIVASESQVAANIGAELGEITGKGSQFRFVQKLAQKEFCKVKARNDAEVSRRAEKELFDQFNSETSKLISDGQDRIDDAFEKSQSVSAFVPELYMRSHFDRIEVVGNKSSISALAATNGPLEHAAGRDIQLRLHDSVISNYLDPIFSGKEISRTELAAKAQELTGTVPEFLQPQENPETGEPMEDFVITFASIRPIQISFSDNRLKVAISCARFAQGDQSITAPLVIRLQLKVVNAGGKLLLEQDQVPTIKILEDADPSPESIALLALLEKQIEENDVNPREQATELPANLIPDLEQLKDADFISSLQLGLFKMEQGWLYLGWNYQGCPFVETPAIWTEQVINQLERLYTPAFPEMRVDDTATISTPVPTLNAGPIHYGQPIEVPGEASSVWESTRGFDIDLPASVPVRK